MMIHSNKTLLAAAISVLLNLTTHHTDARSKKQDPIVGASAVNAILYVDTPNPTPVFGVQTYHADGTYELHMSEFLTQRVVLPLGPGTPTSGAFITIATGAWKKIGKHKYKTVASVVVLARGIDCATGVPTGDLAAPACPFIRGKAEFITDLNADCLTSSFTGTVTWHPIDNIALDQPAPSPFNTFVNHLSGVARKVDVCS